MSSVEWYTYTMSEINHGTLTAYTYHSCRCDECRAVASAYNKQKHEERKTAGLAPGAEQHGTKNGYINYGCRCGECRVAMNNPKLALDEHGFGHKVWIRELGGWFVVGEKITP